MTNLLLIIAFILLATMKRPKALPPSTKQNALKIVLFWFIQSTATAQPLPPSDSLFASLRRFHDENTAANLEPFNTIERRAWMKWTPSIGIQYNLQGQPRPALSFSFAQVYNNLNDKENRRAQKSQILRGSKIAFQTDSFSLVALLKKRQVLDASMTWLKEIAALENRKYQIDKAKYEAAQITESAWIEVNTANLRSSETFFNRIQELELLDIEILKLAKF